MPEHAHAENRGKEQAPPPDRSPQAPPANQRRRARSAAPAADCRAARAARTKATTKTHSARKPATKIPIAYARGSSAMPGNPTGSSAMNDRIEWDADDGKRDRRDQHAPQRNVHARAPLATATTRSAIRRAPPGAPIRARSDRAHALAARVVAQQVAHARDGALVAGKYCERFTEQPDWRLRYHAVLRSRPRSNATTGMPAAAAASLAVPACPITSVARANTPPSGPRHARTQRRDRCGAGRTASRRHPHSRPPNRRLRASAAKRAGSRAGAIESTAPSAGFSGASSPTTCNKKRASA